VIEEIDIKNPMTRLLCTLDQQNWFAHLRIYGPTKAYFDETYPLEDIKLVKKGK
jgi:hypothetical protein